MSEMFKTKGWFSGGLWKPKNPHSLEHLKYLYHVLSKNQVVHENNRSLLVETLRSIAEILIWGDQNDSTVFDFFLEKNMLSYFLIIMKQKCGRYVCVQLLQTLNILFENIRNETSLYYLLSNNHVNSIIVHKFDFSDEEVLAYYISFLKTLSLKLNTHTIHFFYNEHTNDFPLYTEAIKFFNHSESMVRIAVRTLTLNVYKVDDKSMLKFIRDKTAAPYFSNLVWFIGNHIIELDTCVRNDADHQSRDRLADLVAEHLDHLHYLNDILCLHIDSLNEVLTDHLLKKLLLPLYVYSLTKRRRHSQIEDDRPHVSSVVSLFLLSQVFLIISHPPLVRQLADIILNGDMSIFAGSANDVPQAESSSASLAAQVEPDVKTPHMGIAAKFEGFIAPSETLVQSLESNKASNKNKPFRNIKRPNYRNSDPVEPGEAQNGLPKISVDSGVGDTTSVATTDGSITPPDESSSTDDGSDPVFYGDTDLSSPNLNSTDEEKQLAAAAAAHRYEHQQPTIDELQCEFTLANRPYLEAIFNALECSENDYAALFALCLLYALGHNQGINQDLLDSVLMPTERSETKSWYNQNLVDRLVKILSLSCHKNCKVRLATLELTILLLKQLVYKNGHSYLQDRHLAASEDAKEESILLLRNFYKSEEMFLDMFEDEYRELRDRPLNVEYLTMDSSILLPPTGTPLTGIEFSKRLPCGDVERARRAIRGFLLLRDLSFTMRNEKDLHLPLTRDEECIKVSNVLDLNNSDLIACTVIHRDMNQRSRRFLVIDVAQMILVEPDSKRLGWGIARFVGFLQDIEVTGDKDDSRSLHIVIHKPVSSIHNLAVSARHKTLPLLAARFIFDDHIRCMAAKQRLTKGRLKARQMKMHMIAKLLDLPYHIQPCPSPPVNAIASRSSHHPPLSSSSPQSSSSTSGTHPLQQSYPELPTTKPRNQRPDVSSKKPTHASMTKVPGFAAMVRRDSGIILNSAPPKSNKSQSTRQSPRYRGRTAKEYGSSEDSGDSSDNSASTFAFSRMDLQKGHHHSSPKTQPRSSSSSPRARHRDSEEIPLEDFSKNKPARISVSGSSSFAPARSGSASPQRSPRNMSPAGSINRLDKTGDKTPPFRRSSIGSPALSSPVSNQKSGRSVSAPVHPSPKSLRPAEAPPLSLIPTNDDDPGTLGSPKLLPPAEPEHLRYITDSSSEGDLKSSASDSTSDSCPVSETSFMEETRKNSAGEAPPSTSTEAGAVVKKDSAFNPSDKHSSATEQLTKLAQLVQEHYGTGETSSPSTS